MSFSPTICDQCRRPSVDQIGLSIARFDRLTPDQFGFCSQACFVLFVRSHYIENASPAVASPAPARGSAGRSGAGNGATGRVSGPPSDQAGAPPSNEHRPVAANDEPAEWASVAARSEGTA